VGYETKRGFHMKGFCVVLEEGYEKRQGVRCDSCTGHQESCKEDEKKIKKGEVKG